MHLSFFLQRPAWASVCTFWFSFFGPRVKLQRSFGCNLNSAIVKYCCRPTDRYTSETNAIYKLKTWPEQKTVNNLLSLIPLAVVRGRRDVSAPISSAAETRSRCLVHSALSAYTQSQSRFGGCYLLQRVAIWWVDVGGGGLQRWGAWHLATRVIPMWFQNSVHYRQNGFSKQVFNVDYIPHLNFAAAISASFLTFDDKRLRLRNPITPERSRLPTKSQHSLPVYHVRRQVRGSVIAHANRKQRV